MTFQIWNVFEVSSESDGYCVCPLYMTCSSFSIALKVAKELREETYRRYLDRSRVPFAIEDLGPIEIGTVGRTQDRWDGFNRSYPKPSVLIEGCFMDQPSSDRVQVPMFVYVK